MSEKPVYRWPDLSPVVRQYVVQDDQGRYGIAYEDHCHHAGVLFAHPIDVRPIVSPEGVPGAEILPSNALLMTNTVFHSRGDGTYQGMWYDDRRTGQIPPGELRVLTILDDLGYVLPDDMAERFLAGSDEMGHWDGDTFYTPAEAAEMTDTAESSWRNRAAAGKIAGAIKKGKQWLIPAAGIGKE